MWLFFFFSIVFKDIFIIVFLGIIKFDFLLFLNICDYFWVCELIVIVVVIGLLYWFMFIINIMFMDELVDLYVIFVYLLFIVYLVLFLNLTIGYNKFLIFSWFCFFIRLVLVDIFFVGELVLVLRILYCE